MGRHGLPLTALCLPAVARAIPDGHPLLHGRPAPRIVNPHLMRGVPYDPAGESARWKQVVEAAGIRIE